jgi:hypothetical protein
MSSSFANQTIAQIELFTKPNDYESGKVTCCQASDEKVARLSRQLGAQLTVLTEAGGVHPASTRAGRTSRIRIGIDASSSREGGDPGFPPESPIPASAG